MKKTCVYTAIFLGMTLLLPAKVFAQSSGAANKVASQPENAAPTKVIVAGIVQTTHGTPIPAATVRVVHVPSGQAWVSWTDETGKFTLAGLPAGRYRLEARQLGFQAAQAETDFAGTPGTSLRITLQIVPPMTENAANQSKQGLQANPSKNTAGSPSEPAKVDTAEESSSRHTSTDRATGTAESEKAGTNKAESNKKASRHQSSKAANRGEQPVAANSQNPASENAANSPNGGAKPKVVPLSAEGSVPGDDALSSLGDASSSDAFLMRGTVNRATSLGGMGSFTGVGGVSGSGNPYAAASADEAGLFSGQDSSGAADQTGGGRRRRGHKSRNRSRQRAQARAVAQPEGFGQGIEELLAQRRLAQLTADRVRFSFYNAYDNSVWDARPFSLTQPNPPKISHYDERFGAHVGGPMVIPHIYNGREQTFFFVKYELERQRLPLDVFSTVPTPSERQGDFSDRGIQLFDPASNLTGPRTPLGSSIPQSKLNQVSLGLLRFIPLPNLPGTAQNFHLQAQLPFDSDAASIKILHTLTPKLSLAVSYNMNSTRQGNPFAMPLLPGHQSGLGQAVNMGLTQNWSSRAINETRINWSRNAIRLLNLYAFQQDIASDLGITGISQAPIDFGVPLISFTNFTALNDPVPALHRNQTLRLLDNFSYMFSKHTIRTGGEIRWMQINATTDPTPRGAFNFTGLMTSQLDAQGRPVPGTGLDFADFLMGLPQSTTVRFGSSSTYFRNREYIVYAQDDWRVRPSFAVTLGARYEFMTPPVELFNHIADLAANPGITAVRLVFPGNSTAFGSTLPRSLIRPDVNNWAPRVGIAWRPPRKLPLVVRAGYGIFYNESVYNQLAASMANQPPFAQAQTRLTSTANILTLQNGFPEVPQGDVKNTVAVDPNYQVGYAQLWDFSVESQIKPSLVIEAIYTGTKGTHLDMLRAPNRATPGSPFDTDLSRRIPNAPGFTYDTFGSSSIFHALQLLAQRRMAHGLMIQGVYTFAKSIDNASSIGGGAPVVVQDDNNFRAERGLSSFDIRHQFRAEYSYELPFGETKRWLRNSWESSAFGNWQLSGVTMISSGTPFTARVLGNAADNTGTGVKDSERADQIGSPSLASGQRTPQHFFNTAAFALPPAGLFGNAARNTIPGPGVVNFDFALAKKFHFGQDNRMHLDWRWEVQNLMNTPNFVGLDTVINSITYGRVQGVKPMRTMDLMLRLRF